MRGSKYQRENGSCVRPWPRGVAFWINLVMSLMELHSERRSGLWYGRPNMVGKEDSSGEHPW
jgi:hypothetical protein